MKLYFTIPVLLGIVSFADKSGYTFSSEPSITGVYYTYHDNPKYYHSPYSIECLYFYRDKTFCFISNDTNTTQDSMVLTDMLRNPKKFQYNSFWGYYRSDNDTILTTSYIHDSQRMGKISENWQMVIKDSGRIIEVKKTVCNRCRGQYSEYGSNNTILYRPAKEYRLALSAVKPDSSQMWLRQKKWFRSEINKLNQW